MSKHCWMQRKNNWKKNAILSYQCNNNKTNISWDNLLLCCCFSSSLNNVENVLNSVIIIYCMLINTRTNYIRTLVLQDEFADVDVVVVVQTTRAMSLLSGSFARFPSQRLLWMVKASMVTVKCFVWILVNFLPPELYLKWIHKIISYLKKEIFPFILIVMLSKECE